MALSALSLAIPAAAVIADGQGRSRARQREYRGHDRRYRAKRCRHSSGTTGLVAGGVGGAVLGNAVGGGAARHAAPAVQRVRSVAVAIDRTITAKDRCR